jgi:cysteine desulfurase/selenocysteine lyase
MSPILDIKQDFGIYDNNPEFAYFDSASTTLIPKIAVNAVSDFLTNTIVSTRRGTHNLAVKGKNIVEKTRSDLADFVQTSNEQISFQKSISSAVASFAYGYNWQTLGKKKIVIAESEEHSILVSLLRVAEVLNLQVELIPINKDGQLDMECLVNTIDTNTGIVAVGHVTVGLGIKNPIYEIAKITHENEALLITDATRSIGLTTDSLPKLQSDVLFFSGNIGLMGPPGLAIQWINKSLEEEHKPGILGSSAISKVENASYRISQAPDKFESDILNLPAIAGLESSINYLQQLESKKIMTHIEQLSSNMKDRLSEIPEIVIYGLNNSQKSIFGFSISNQTEINPHDVALFLDQSNIAVRSGFLCAHPLVKRVNPNGIIQVSLHAYNSILDIDILVNTLQSICKQLL